MTAVIRKEGEGKQGFGHEKPTTRSRRERGVRRGAAFLLVTAFVIFVVFTSLLSSTFVSFVPEQAEAQLLENAPDGRQEEEGGDDYSGVLDGKSSMVNKTTSTSFSEEGYEDQGRVNDVQHNSSSTDLAELRGGKHRDNVNPPLEEAFAFSQQKLNLTLDRYICGGYKCFFPGSGTGEYGYIVSRRFVPKAKKNLTRSGQIEVLLKMQVAAYNFAKNLQSDLGLRHLLGPSAVFNLNAEFTRKLNAANLWKMGSPVSTDFFNAEGGPFVVTRARIAPTPHLLIKRFDKAETRLPAFVAPIVPGQTSKTKDRLNSVDAAGQKFLRTFRAECDKVSSLIEMFPCLAEDFQILLDADGKIWHLDLDRCFDFNHRTRTADFRKKTKSSPVILEKMQRTNMVLKEYVEVTEKLLGPQKRKGTPKRVQSITTWKRATDS